LSRQYGGYRFAFGRVGGVYLGLKRGKTVWKPSTIFTTGVTRFAQTQTPSGKPESKISALF